MIHELRIYSFHEGQADVWLQAFLEKLVPLYESNGVEVPGVWRDFARNQVVWFRVFRDEEHQKTAHAAVVASPGFKALGGLFRQTGITVLEERNLAPVLLTRFPSIGQAHELRFYGVKDGKMDEWVGHFLQKVKPIFEAHGAAIPAAWRDDTRSRFYWFRVFANEQEQSAAQAVVLRLPEWQTWLRGPFLDVGAVVLETRNLVPVFPPRFA